MQYEVLTETGSDQSLINNCSEFSLSLSRSARKEGLLSFLSLDMNAIAISKYSSESLAGISMESLERVFPLEVHGVVSWHFKVGNTAGEYTGCGSSPHQPHRDPKKYI
jgi:hypothetical protein